MTKLATRWMKERGLEQKGAKYILDKLPDGYALYGKTRQTAPTHVDRYLYGHPRYAFRSCEEFYDHFKCLMDNNGNADSCTCVGCFKGRKRQSMTAEKPKKSAAVPITTPVAGSLSRQYPTRPFVSREGPLLMTQNLSNEETSFHPSNLPDYDNVDEEGTPDVYQLLINKLRARSMLDEAITEESSFDWRIEKAEIPAYWNRLKNDPRFIPRIGEIVLFVRECKETEYVAYDSESNSFQTWDRAEQAFTGTPSWSAGIVTEIPQEKVDIADLVMEEGGKEHQVNYSGFRIELYPQAGSDDKMWSKRSTYKPLHLIRPFIFYKDYLKGIKPVEWHPTLGFALTIMSSLCVVDKYHFKGIWPSATVFNKGIYLGAELLVVGDAVRLMPSKEADPTQVTSVMKMTSIKMKLINLDAAENPDFDPVDEEDKGMHQDYRTCIHICGIALTNDPARAWGMGKLPIDVASSGIATGLTGKWYYLHDPERRWEVPFMQVMGRYYEDDAVRLWFSRKAPSSTLPPVPTFAAVNRPEMNIPDHGDAIDGEADLGKGLKGLQMGRSYSIRHDERIRRTDGKSWFWADTRVEQLDLHEFKGQAVNRLAEPDTRSWRDTRAWKRAHKIREKGAGFTLKPGHSSSVGAGTPRFGNSMMKASATSLGMSSGNEMEVDTDMIRNQLGNANLAEAPANDDDEDSEDVEMIDAPVRGTQAPSGGESRIDLAGISSGDDDDEEEDEDDVADQMIDQLAGGAELPARGRQSGTMRMDVIDLD